jgi:hypothetical protein
MILSYHAVNPSFLGSPGTTVACANPQINGLSFEYFRYIQSVLQRGRAQTVAELPIAAVARRNYATYYLTFASARSYLQASGEGGRLMMKNRDAKRVVTRGVVVAFVVLSQAGSSAYAAAVGGWGRSVGVPTGVVRVQADQVAIAMTRVQSVIAQSTNSSGVVNATVLSAGIGAIVAANPAVAAQLTRAILTLAKSNPAIASALVQGIAIGAASLAVTNPSAAAAIQTAVADAVADGTISASLGGEFNQALSEASQSTPGGLSTVVVNPDTDDDDDSSPN